MDDADDGIDKDLEKYWVQRYALFSRFDEGIQLDRVGWYSVTPEAIAAHTARRFLQALGPNIVIIDAMTGVGGNAIQFAHYFSRVVAIDLSEERIKLAEHNARIYGVADRIDFILGDFIELVPYLKADAIFLSPPWGGPDYISAEEFDIKKMEIDGFELFQAAMQISPNIAYYLPKNTSETQIGELAMLNSGVVEIEANFLNDRIKALTAYFGALAGSDFTLEEGYEGECEPDPGSGPRRSRRKKRKLSHILLLTVFQEPFPRKELDDLKEQLSRFPKDTDRMRLIRRVGVNYSLSSADLKELVDTMSYGQAAVDTVVMMFSRLRDPDGVDAVIDAFTYPEDKVAIRSKLGR